METRNSLKKHNAMKLDSATSLESLDANESKDTGSAKLRRPRHLPALGDFIMSRTHEVVKINLTGLGDTEVGHDFAVLDRQNKFLMTTDDDDDDDDDDDSSTDGELSVARLPSRNGDRCGETSCGDGLHGGAISHVSKLHPFVEQKLKKEEEIPVEPNCSGTTYHGDRPWRVIEVEPAVIQHDSTRLAPTLVIKSIEEEDAKDKAERERCFRRAYGLGMRDKDEQKTDLNICLEGKNIPKLNQNTPSSAQQASHPDTDSDEFEPGYVVIQGEFNTLTLKSYNNTSNNGRIPCEATPMPVPVGKVLKNKKILIGAPTPTWLSRNGRFRSKMDIRRIRSGLI